MEVVGVDHKALGKQQLYTHKTYLLSSLTFCRIKNSFDFIVYTTGGCSIYPL
jgi:hypothetical protein